MERISESPESPREREARGSLELSAVKIEDSRITGELQGFQVVLEGDVPFHGCKVELSSRIPLVSLVMRAGDLNEPEAVETGDVEFDEAMQVLAEPTFVPTIAGLLTKDVRQALLAFLKRFPDSTLTATTLHVKSEAPLTQKTVLEAVALVKLISAQFAANGFLDQEEPPKLPDDADTRDPHTTLDDRIRGVGQISVAAIGALWFFGWVFDWPNPALVATTVAIAGLGLWRGWVLGGKA
ncbi:MAG: hypothetical protein QM817_40040 [Archangium sp.]